MKLEGKETAEANAAAVVTRKDGTKEVIQAEQLPETIRFQPWVCICGGVWLMLEGTEATVCPYCGEPVDQGG